MKPEGEVYWLREIWWTFNILSVLVGIIGTLTALVPGLPEGRFLFGIEATPEIRTAVYTFLLVDGGWRVWLRMAGQ